MDEESSREIWGEKRNRLPEFDDPKDTSWGGKGSFGKTQSAQPTMFFLSGRRKGEFDPPAAKGVYGPEGDHSSGNCLTPTEGV